MLAPRSKYNQAIDVTLPGLKEAMRVSTAKQNPAVTNSFFYPYSILWFCSLSSLRFYRCEFVLLFSPCFQYLPIFFVAVTVIFFSIMVSLHLCSCWPHYCFFLSHCYRSFSATLKLVLNSTMCLRWSLFHLHYSVMTFLTISEFFHNSFIPSC